METLVSRARCNAIAATSAFVIASAMLPGTANAGFFENLFGGGTPAPQAAPSFSYDAPQNNDFGTDLPRVQRPRRHIVLKEVAPVRQKTTDIWHDKTLRDGDAVMMKDGLHVYNGPNGEKPVARDLPRIDNADISRKERALLVAMDTTRNDPLKAGLAPDTIASGRSAAVANPAVAGYKITDARGKSVRYVGP